MTQGKLFYVVGASGQGKDSPLTYARERLEGTHPVMFAHCYVTRPSTAGHHCCIVLSEGEFALRKRHGLFALTWQSRDGWCGIGSEINYWLAMGLSVVANGSRGHLGEALVAYPDMIVIWVTGETLGADPAAESTDRKAQPIAAPSADRRIIHIRNGEPATFAGERLLALLVGTSA